MFYSIFYYTDLLKNRISNLIAMLFNANSKTFQKETKY